jgi:hypothetical protein
MNQQAIRERFSAALDALVDHVKADRSILAVTDHTPVPMSRALGDRTRAPRRPAMSPAVTTASTPLTWIASAGR